MIEKVVHVIGVTALALIAFTVVVIIITPVLPGLVAMCVVLWLTLRLVVGPHFHSRDGDRH